MKKGKVLCYGLFSVAGLMLLNGCSNLLLAPEKSAQIVRISSDQLLTKQADLKDNWELIWNDEFEDINGDGSLDKHKWGYEVGLIRNKEAQYYTKNCRKNVRVENGKLVIEGIKEKFSDKKGKKAEYTSGSINTLGKFSFKYGRVDIRAKLPSGRGVWPAIWMMGIDRSIYGWPRCGEIDIMEYVGNGKDAVKIHSTVHGPNYNWKKKDEPRTGHILFDKPPVADFHIYSLEWSEKNIKFFFDGQHYLTFKNTQNKDWVYSKPYYILLNLALGGSWGGKIDDSIFPVQYYVDYVRVYKKVK